MWRGKKIAKSSGRMEYAAFTTALQGALADLSKRKTLTYNDVLTTHKTLFDAVYPWAGEDRLKQAPDKAITKGDGGLKVRFADPPDIQRSIDYALCTPILILIVRDTRESGLVLRMRHRLCAAAFIGQSHIALR